MSVIRIRRQEFAATVREVALVTATIILIPKLFAILQIKYFFLAYRVAYLSIFQESIFGNPVFDSLVISSLAIFFLYRALKLHYWIVVASSSMFISIISVLVVHNGLIIDFLAIVLMGLSISNMIIKRILNFVNTIQELRVSRLFIIFFIAISGIELIAITRWIVNVIIPSKIYSDQTWALTKLDAEIFHVLGGLSVYLIMLLPVSFLLWPLKHYVCKLLESKKSGNAFTKTEERIRNYHGVIIKRKVAILSLMLVFSALLPSLSLLPSINPTGQPFGTDFYDYAARINRLSSYNLFNFFQNLYTQNSERPLTILFIILFQKALNLTSIIAVESIPVMLSPLLVFTSYRFAKIAFDNESLSLLIAFMTMTSIYVVVGLYGGFIGNWMAIICTFWFLCYLLKFWQSPNRINFVIMLALLIMIQFIHVYTWTYLTVTLTLFVLWSLYVERKNASQVKVIIVIATAIAISVGVDILKTYVGGISVGLETDKALVNQFVSPELFATRWYNLTYSIGVYLGGGLGNALPIVLSLVWIISTSWKTLTNRLLGSLFFGLAPLMLFGDYTIQARLVYMMPVCIGASLGAYLLGIRLKEMPILVIVVFSFIILSQLNYVLRSISNFYLILPGH